MPLERGREESCAAGNAPIERGRSGLSSESATREEREKREGASGDTRCTGCALMASGRHAFQRIGGAEAQQRSLAALRSRPRRSFHEREARAVLRDENEPTTGGVELEAPRTPERAEEASFERVWAIASDRGALDAR